jgi:hypothetical protein
VSLVCALVIKERKLIDERSRVASVCYKWLSVVIDLAASTDRDNKLLKRGNVEGRVGGKFTSAGIRNRVCE